MKSTRLKHFIISLLFMVGFSACFSYNPAYAQSSNSTLDDVVDEIDNLNVNLVSFWHEFYDFYVDWENRVITDYSAVLQSLVTIQTDIRSYISYIAGLVSVLEDNIAICRIQTSQQSITVGTGATSGTYILQGFQIPWYVYQNENITLTTSIKYCNFSGMLSSYFQGLLSWGQAFGDMFRSWFYPLKASNETQYWRVYNSDTEQYESVNPATVTGYITWYLGKLYEGSLWADANEALEEAADKIEGVTSQVDAAESAISGSVSGFVNDFNPQIDFSVIPALGWLSNYLQQIFVYLGNFSIPIMLALFLSVCMQFIGYFKYKA